MVGPVEGAVVGCGLGEAEIAKDGPIVGIVDGVDEGALVEHVVGDVVGIIVGSTVGSADGSGIGGLDGSGEGD